MNRATKLLIDHSRAAGCGEFISASQLAEVHVFLQHGRVAWATDSKHPFEFVRHLKEAGRIDDDSFKEVLETCRRDRLPLGETLVEWGLVRRDEVLGALRHQVRLALETLGKIADADVSTIFLERRRFAEYDERLTFDVEAMVAAIEGEHQAATPPPSTLGETSDTGAAATLLASIRGAIWTQLLELGRPIESAGKLTDVVSSIGLLRMTLDDGADMIAMRWPDGCLAGTHLETPARQLWCQLSTTASFGAAIAAISQLNPSRRRMASSVRAPIAWTVGNGDLPALHAAFAYSSDVLAAGLFDPSGAVVAAAGTAEMEQAEARELVTRRGRALSATTNGVATGQLGALGFRSRMIVTGEPKVWCFGAENWTGSDAPTLWVLLRRQAPQGVGWACLTATARTAFSEGQP